MEHTGNQKLNNLSDISQTLNEGGWYRANLIPDKLTFLAFNSLQLNDLNTHKSVVEKLLELEWLREQLSNAG